MKDTKAKSSTDIFNDLKGSWKINRIITNNLNKSEKFDVIGLVEIKTTLKNSNILNYEESVIITWGKNQTQDARKKYQFVLKNGVIEQHDHAPSKNKDYFQKMYSLNIDENHKATGTYICNQDIYIAFFNFSDPHKFSIEYKATGPNKDFSTHTIFTRANEQKTNFNNAFSR